MKKLTREDLYSLESYAEQRSEFREKVIQHKKHRRIAIGENANLYFEDRMTMQYQIQEMLRVEKIFEAAEIEEELSAYNPLIPDGSNWKATFMLEYSDENQRREALAELVGIEHKAWVKVGELEKVYAVADEDLERSTEEKTSSVHFLRFELDKEMVQQLNSGASLSAGIDHPAYLHSVDPVNLAVVESLIQDLD